MSVGENIQKFRKKKKLTQDELAKLICVSPKTISSYENNRNLPSIDILISLSKHLDVSLDTLLSINESGDKIKNDYAKRRKDGLIITLIIGIFSVIYFFFSEYMILGSLMSINGVKDVISVNGIKYYIFLNLFIYSIVLLYLYIMYYLKLGEKKLIVTIISIIVLILIVSLLLIFI